MDGLHRSWNLDAASLAVRRRVMKLSIVRTGTTDVQAGKVAVTQNAVTLLNRSIIADYTIAKSRP